MVLAAFSPSDLATLVRSTNHKLRLWVILVAYALSALPALLYYKLESFRLDYEYDFSILVFRLHFIMSHTHFIHELLSLPKTNMKNKGSGNVTGLKFENRTRTQSRTRSPI